LRRVSTEQQERHGESLRTQTTQIEQAVARLGGRIVKWYGGQEHATEGHEKEQIAILLADASQEPKPFDALMVSHADRWSRDNRASRHGLELLQQHHVRFFTLDQEHDLYDPDAELFLGLSAVIGGYQAKIQRKKSIESRIHRAQRNIPTCGHLPFGRTFDKATGKWGVDPAKKKVIEEVARRYLAGEQMTNLAEEFRMNHSNLHKIVTRLSGTKWVLHFRSPDLNIKEEVTVDIPPLLSPETIKRVLAKVAANRTYQHDVHAKKKSPYLLSRNVRCEKCGYAYVVQTNHNGTRYYRHAHGKQYPKCPKVGWVPAEELEDAVIRHLFNTYGNAAALERAIDAAVPNLDAHRQIQQRISKLDGLIQQTDQGRQRILRLVESGEVDHAETKDLLKANREKQERYQTERDELAGKVSTLPTVNQIKETARRVASRFKRPTKAEMRVSLAAEADHDDFVAMTWDDKRELLELVFDGTSVEGKRAAVYLDWPRGKGSPCRYTLRGLIQRTATLPMQPRTKEYLANPGHIQAGEQGAVTSYATGMCHTQLRR